MRLAIIAPLSALAIVACSPAADRSDSFADGNAVENAVSVENAAAPQPAPTAKANERTIGPDGLGALRIGAPLPRSGSWTADDCAATSPEFKDVYALLDGGKVGRITLRGASDVKLATGIAIGSTEAAVRAAFPDIREEPAKYAPAPAKVLATPEATTSTPGWRFEIGASRRVEMIHVGLLPTLALSEGCG